MANRDTVHAFAKALAEAAKSSGVPVEVTLRAGHPPARLLSEDEAWKEFGREEALQIVTNAIRQITGKDVSGSRTDTLLNKVNIDTDDMVKRLQRRTLILTSAFLKPEVLDPDKFMGEQL